MTNSPFSNSAPSKKTAVKNPTWYADIRYMFTDIDKDHMGNQSLDLSSYDAVRENGSSIYAQVSAGNMPPKNPWSKAWVDTFLNWLIAGYPKGTQPASTIIAEALSSTAASSATRIRKEITTLSSAELETLKKAFQGIMDLEPTDPNSYFVQAGYHWLPGPKLYCQHHVPAYNPWHRAYMYNFENALRSVPGCEDVTLPYWDITTPFPDVLKAAPFDKYTLPKDIGEGFNKGYVTQRYSYETIASNLLQYAVTEDLNRALTKNTWEAFNGWFDGVTHNTIIQAHDSGHVSIGSTMAQQSVAAFDPIFWFFHANWDRLLWQWQQEMDATTKQGLLTTITSDNSRNIFTIPPLAVLPPFSDKAPNLTTINTIDIINDLDVDYVHPAIKVAGMKTAETKQFAKTSDSFSINPQLVNVRVSDVDRLNIPGSFSVHLLKDGKILASKSVFQPQDPNQCRNCKQNGLANFDFELPLKEVSDGKLSVQVEPVNKDFVGDKFPDKMMGNPKVDIHMRLQHD